MAEIIVINEEEVRRSLPLEELVSSLTRALIALSEGNVSVPPRIAASTEAGLLAAMPGYVPGLGVAAKLVSFYPRNPHSGRPAHQALIAVFDEESGAPLAVMDGTYITAIRTAMTAALAAQGVAGRRGSLAVIGAGVQADAHLTAFTHLLQPDEIRLASRDEAKAANLAALHPNVVATKSMANAVREADMVCCCTDALDPVLEDRWIGQGTFVSSVGSGRELPADLIARSRVYVESRSATLPPPAGAAELQGRDPASLIEIGAILSGRDSADGQTSVFKSTGHAVEDIAAAAVVVRNVGGSALEQA